MSIQANAPWHKASYRAFLNESFPRLLGQRLPLAAYHVQDAQGHLCRMRISLSTGSGELSTVLDVPQCDDDGVFEIDSHRYVVAPVASHEELDQAQIRCVGEQLYDYISSRLGEAPGDLPWDQSLVQSWLPIDAWVRQFICEQCDELGGLRLLNERNWLARCEHLRCLLVPTAKEVLAKGQLGLVCPIQTPEGDNIGRVLRVAVGAEIRDGRLAVADTSPAASLSMAASMIPFLEHSDSNRLLMGANMMRQWIAPDVPEPALVQTGNEPAEEGFWCGRNLLTAFISLGADTHEDSIVVSASAAGRLSYGRPLGIGDKLSNRHGTKGTISRILSDQDMPHLGDGTPVDLVFDFIGLHTRLNFGQVREAVIGRIAKAQGKPAMAPAFASPSAEQLKEGLVRAGLDASGMEMLTLGREGPKLARPSTVGYVYWGKLQQTRRLADEMVHAGVAKNDTQMQGELEYLALRDVKAYHTLREQFSTRSAAREAAESLAKQVAVSQVEQAPPPTPPFAKVVRGLSAAGVQADLDGQKLVFRLAPPEGNVLKLARPVRHPWLDDRQIAEVGLLEEVRTCKDLLDANGRLGRMLSEDAPPGMIDRAAAQLQQKVAEYMDSLLVPDPDQPAWTTNHLQADNRVLFSGRAVLAVGADLRHDQVGLAGHIAWTLFGPAVSRTVGPGALAERTSQADAALRAVMAESWVIVQRAPTLMPTAFLAFRPILIDEPVIRLHPMACMLMNADFDGDQATVFLPVTQAGQREAGEKLTIEGHLRRDSSLLRWMVPSHSALWGLAQLSLTPSGRQEIDRLAGTAVGVPDGLVTRASIEQAMRARLQADAPLDVIEAMERLFRRGFEQARASGASLSPFVGSQLRAPPPPSSDQGDLWDVFSEELAARLADWRDFASADLGPQALAVVSGSRGSWRHMVNLLGSRGTLPGLDGEPTVIRHGFVQGLTPKEFLVVAMHGRRALGQLAIECTRAAYGASLPRGTTGLGVLARAMRAARPGVVFARAAANAEFDPLTDLDSRLFVGLDPLG